LAADLIVAIVAVGGAENFVQREQCAATNCDKGFRTAQSLSCSVLYLRICSAAVRSLDLTIYHLVVEKLPDGGKLTNCKLSLII